MKALTINVGGRGLESRDIPAEKAQKIAAGHTLAAEQLAADRQHEDAMAEARPSDEIIAKLRAGGALSPEALEACVRWLVLAKVGPAE